LCQVRRITNDLGDYLSASISADGRTIASVQLNRSSNVWVGDGKTPGEAKQVTSGRYDGVFGFSWTPDEHIVYTANPSQNIGLFVMDADGGNAKQVSFDQAPHAAPVVCEGGRSVVYDTDFEGNWHLWKLDLPSGVTAKLTKGFGEIDASCPRAGDLVMYKGQVSDGTAYIWKMPLSGGAPVRVSDRVAITGPSVSADGRHLAFPSVQKEGTVAVVIVSAETGAQETQLEIPPTLDTTSRTVSWTPDSRSIAISDLRSGSPNLWDLPVFAQGNPQQFTHFTSGTIWSFQWSASGKRFAIARGSNTSDVVLLNDTR
jgi:Tol biopolymer transport system component